MHGFKFTAVELDDVMQESMEDEFLEVQSGEKELSDADLDLVAAGKFWGGGGSKTRPGKKPPQPCSILKRTNKQKYEKYCKR